MRSWVAAALMLPALMMVAKIARRCGLSMDCPSLGNNVSSDW
jgi:hypothetical protein